MTRGLTVGTSGIQGSLAPHYGQLVASAATGIPQSRQETIREGVPPYEQLRCDRGAAIRRVSVSTASGIHEQHQARRAM